MLNAWQPLKTLAQSDIDGWQIELQPTQPTQPIVIQSPLGTRWPALSIRPMPRHSLQVEEVYVRQKDLIARFSQSPQDQFGFQVDWRLLDPLPGFSLGIEVWVSIQTELLDSVPLIRVESESQNGWQSYQHQQLVDSASTVVPADQGWSDSPSTIAALGFSDSDIHALWLFDPRDQSQVNWISANQALLQQAELFGTFLEKGVIRRARMQLWVSNKSIDMDAARRAYHQLIQRDLPLTV
jgi:hypothetical protein